MLYLGPSSLRVSDLASPSSAWVSANTFLSSSEIRRLSTTPSTAEQPRPDIRYRVQYTRIQGGSAYKQLNVRAFYPTLPCPHRYVSFASPRSSTASCNSPFNSTAFINKFWFKARNIAPWSCTLLSTRGGKACNHGNRVIANRRMHTALVLLERRVGFKDLPPGIPSPAP